ncbi:MAG TPA: SIMPL domain-containing protein [Granulicella sp.]|jgi:uncharacterized protein YggE|nr:SIMPL domain-containing protein [Granulicella sp.]
MKLASIARNSVVLAVVFASPLIAWGQTIQVSKENRTIAVTTSDEAEALADRAKVTVGFTLYGSDQDQTYADATRTSGAIMKALRDSGIKPEAIESTEQSLSAIDDNDKTRYNKGIRFVCSQRWVVTVPADRAADTLHAAITAGANNSGEVSWELADDRALEAEAATAALAHAQQIAERMAKGLNARLGPLVYASNQAPPRIGFYGLNTSAAAMSTNSKANLKPLALRPAKISRSATIYAVFSLE